MRMATNGIGEGPQRLGHWYRDQRVLVRSIPGGSDGKVYLEDVLLTGSARSVDYL